MFSAKIVDDNENISFDQTAEDLLIVRKEPNANRWCTEIQNQYKHMNTDATSAATKPITDAVVNNVPDSQNMNKKTIQENQLHLDQYHHQLEPNPDSAETRLHHVPDKRKQQLEDNGTRLRVAYDRHAPHLL